MTTSSGLGELPVASGGIGPEGVGLPCHNSNSSNEVALVAKLNRLSSGHRRTAYALRENVKYLAKTFGITRIGLLTLTFQDDVDIKEANRRFNSLRTGILSGHYLAWIVVLERGDKRGRIHFHVLLVCRGDIQTGVDFDAIERRDYRSASSELRGEWSFWRRTAEKYGFGRTELLPVKSTVEAIANYVGKYIAKHIGQRIPEDKGARLVRYSSNARMAGTRFSWAGARGWAWRKKLGTWCELCGFKDTKDATEKFGSSWAYKLRGSILAERVDGTAPTWRHAAEVGWLTGWCSARDDEGQLCIHADAVAEFIRVPLPVSWTPESSAAWEDAVIAANVEMSRRILSEMKSSPL